MKVKINKKLWGVEFWISKDGLFCLALLKPAELPYVYFFVPYNDKTLKKYNVDIKKYFDIGENDNKGNI